MFLKSQQNTEPHRQGPATKDGRHAMLYNSWLPSVTLYVKSLHFQMANTYSPSNFSSNYKVIRLQNIPFIPHLFHLTVCFCPYYLLSCIYGTFFKHFLYAFELLLNGINKQIMRQHPSFKTQIFPKPF